MKLKIFSAASSLQLNHLPNNKYIARLSCRMIFELSRSEKFQLCGYLV